MGASKRVCPNCGRKMKQQFIGLFHCKCGTSWRRDIGFFERTPDMVFSLERKKVGNKIKQLPTIRHKCKKTTSRFSGWWPFCTQCSVMPRYWSISMMSSPLISTRSSKGTTVSPTCKVRNTGSMRSALPVRVM